MVLFQRTKESDKITVFFLGWIRSYGKLSINKETFIVWLTGKLFLKKNRKEKVNKKLKYRMRILTNKLSLQLMYYCY
ncbi:hypothetical protein C0T31_04995 [Dysgonamonadaceae bacterium]|jgi:hypothetical protein|nr:hypothetical protein C0T31_04995 [Dysgonamonadaceae bacterium]